MSLDPNQAAIIAELKKRRDTLDDNQKMMLDEVIKRTMPSNEQVASDAGLSPKSGIAGRLMGGAAREVGVPESALGENAPALAPHVEKIFSDIKSNPSIFASVPGGPEAGMAAWSLIEPSVKNVFGQAFSGNIAGATGATVATAASYFTPAVAEKMGASQLLRKSAERSYGKVLAPTKQIPKALAETKIIPGALERGVMAASEGSLKNKVAGKLDEATEALENAWENLPEGSRLNMQPVWDSMNDMISGAYVKGTNVIERPEIIREANKVKAKILAMRELPEQKLLKTGPISLGPTKPEGEVAQAIVNKADIGRSIERGKFKDVRPLEERMKTIYQGDVRNPEQLTTDLQRAADAQQLEWIDNAPNYIQDSIKARLIRSANDVGTVSTESARSWRQMMDSFIASKPGGFAITKPLAAEAEVKKVATNAIRAELAKTYPDIARVNAEYSFWRNYQMILDETATRRTGQVGPLGRKVVLGAGAAAGLATGGVSSAILDAALVGSADKLFSSTAWRTVSAVTKDRLAHAFASGDAKTANLILKQIGTVASSSE
jgi:hypothetical protein